MNLIERLQHARDLRSQGRGREIQALLGKLTDYQGSALELGQIGIEMNYAGLFPQAEVMLERAISLRELSVFDGFLASNELCIARYSTGQFDAAHRLFRTARLMRDELIQQLLPHHHDAAFLDLLRRKWLGDGPVAGRSVLVALEGGFGDLVMHSRYLPALRAEGAHTIYVATPAAARGMFAGIPWIVETHSIEAVLPNVDVVTWNFDLFWRYQQHPFQNDASWGVPLFGRSTSVIDPVRRPVLRVGIVSASQSTVRQEPFRSISPQALQPLFEAFAGTDVRFHVLNKGGATDIDAATLERYGLISRSHEIHSFSDTVRVLDELDLLISIDTGPAHLAGALGKPVWLLLAGNCDSRWYECRTRTPWFPSMRLYRQTVLGDWSVPVADMIAQLRAAF